MTPPDTRFYSRLRYAEWLRMDGGSLAFKLWYLNRNGSPRLDGSAAGR